MGLAALPWIAIGASAVGTAVSAAGAYEQGQAAKSAGAYQAAVARNNQILSNQQAQLALERGKIEEANKREQTAQMLGQQAAVGAASGVDISSGSPLRITGDTARLGELDALTIRNNAARAAWGYKVQGLDYANQAQLDIMQGQNAARAGNLGAFASIVGGAGSVADKWMRYRQAGVEGFV